LYEQINLFFFVLVSSKCSVLQLLFSDCVVNLIQRKWFLSFQRVL